MVVSPVVTSLSRNTALFPLTVGLGKFARLRPSRKSCRTTTWFALLVHVESPPHGCALARGVPDRRRRVRRASLSDLYATLVDTGPQTPGLARLGASWRAFSTVAYGLVAVPRFPLEPRGEATLSHAPLGSADSTAAGRSPDPLLSVSTTLPPRPPRRPRPRRPIA